MLIKLWLGIKSIFIQTNITLYADPKYPLTYMQHSIQSLETLITSLSNIHINIYYN